MEFMRFNGGQLRGRLGRGGRGIICMEAMVKETGSIVANKGLGGQRRGSFRDFCATGGWLSNVCMWRG